MRAPVAVCLLLLACGAERDAASSQAQAPPVPRTIEKADGCVVEITKDGTGRAARTGDVVTLAYDLRVKDAEKPIASTDGWSVPFELRLGDPAAIPGLSRGVEGLSVGSEARIELPPALAYGAAGKPESGVPPDATLVLQVRVLGMR